MENRNNVPVLDAVIADAIKKITEARTLVTANLVVLSTQEKKRLAKMGDGNLPTVLKAAELVVANPQLLPGYVDGASLQLDAQTLSALLPLVQALEGLLLDVKSTRMLAGAEGYVTALLAYGAFKAAAHNGQPGAQAAVDQIAPRFAGQGKTKTPKAPK